MLQLIPGDDQALRSRAAQLSAGATTLQAIIDQVRATEQQATAAAQNPATTALTRALQHDQVLLGSARDAMQQASQYLNQLANELDQIDAEAVQQRRQMVLQFGHQMLPLTYIEPFLLRANEARSQAAAQLAGLVNRAPGSQQGSHHSFWQDVWDGTVGNLMTGVEDLLKEIWNLTGRGIFDAQGLEKSWSNLIHDTGAIGEHPDQFVRAIFSSLTESDLRHRDFPAWLVATVINIGSLFVGAGEVKAFLKFTELKAALKSTQVLGDTGKLLADFPAIAARLQVLNVPAGTHVWTLQYFVRGFKIEDLVAARWAQENPGFNHLYQTHPGVDMWNSNIGQVTSIKSIDPALPSYANNPSAFYNTLNGYAQKLQNFYPDKINRVDVSPRDYQIKELVIALPDTGLTAPQAAKISELMAQYSQLDITIIEVPR